MNDDLRAQRELEEALHALGAALEPPTPSDYPERVLRVLTQDAERPSVAPWRARITPHRTASRLLMTAAAVLAVAMLLTIAVPGTRRAVASWFDFPGISIHPAAPSQSSSPRTGPQPTPSTPLPLSAGHRVTPAQARQASQGHLRQPAGPHGRGRFFLRRDNGAVVVTIAYREATPLRATPDTGYALIVTEIFNAGEPLLQKILETGAITVPVQVDGDPGVFIRGPQEIITLDRTRTDHGSPVVHEVSSRASADTLIWGHETTTYRLEGDFSRQAALSIADRLR